MLDETGMLGNHTKEEPAPQTPPQPASPARELPKIFSPDKMTPAEMIGAGIVMLGNIAFVSWWAMNEGVSEMAEIIESPEADSGTEVVELVETTPAKDTPGSVMTTVASATAPPAEIQEPRLHIAEVNQGITFKEAFDAARAQVGPGGVFEWHGKWYNTYTSEEWTEMTPHVKEDYATLLKPFIENDGQVDAEALRGVSEDDHHGAMVAQAEHHDYIHKPHETPGELHFDTLDDLFSTT